MPTIFISYRRDDAAGITGRLYDRLRQQFGHEAIIYDVDTIPLGVDFLAYLNDAVGRCDILLAVIGRRWLGPLRGGMRRIHDPRDFVRIEVESALDRGVHVIPVLV